MILVGRFSFCIFLLQLCTHFQLNYGTTLGTEHGRDRDFDGTTRSMRTTGDALDTVTTTTVITSVTLPNDSLTTLDYNGIKSTPKILNNILYETTLPHFEVHHRPNDGDSYTVEGAEGDVTVPIIPVIIPKAVVTTTVVNSPNPEPSSIKDDVDEATSKGNYTTLRDNVTTTEKQSEVHETSDMRTDGETTTTDFVSSKVTIGMVTSEMVTSEMVTSETTVTTSGAVLETTPFLRNLTTVDSELIIDNEKTLSSVSTAKQTDPITYETVTDFTTPASLSEWTSTTHSEANFSKVSPSSITSTLTNIHTETEVPESTSAITEVSYSVPDKTTTTDRHTESEMTTQRESNLPDVSFVTTPITRLTESDWKTTISPEKYSPEVSNSNNVTPSTDSERSSYSTEATEYVSTTSISTTSVSTVSSVVNFETTRLTTEAVTDGTTTFLKTGASVVTEVKTIKLETTSAPTETLETESSAVNGTIFGMALDIKGNATEKAVVALLEEERKNLVTVYMVKDEHTPDWFHRQMQLFSKYVAESLVEYMANWTRPQLSEKENLEMARPEDVHYTIETPYDLKNIRVVSFYVMNPKELGHFQVFPSSMVIKSLERRGTMNQDLNINVTLIHEGPRRDKVTSKSGGTPDSTVRKGLFESYDPLVVALVSTTAGSLFVVIVVLFCWFKGRKRNRDPEEGYNIGQDVLKDVHVTSATFEGHDLMPGDHILYQEGRQGIDNVGNGNKKIAITSAVNETWVVPFAQMPINEELIRMSAQDTKL